jgi:hypothetical protein
MHGFLKLPLFLEDITGEKALDRAVFAEAGGKSGPDGMTIVDPYKQGPAGTANGSFAGVEKTVAEVADGRENEIEERPENGPAYESGHTTSPGVKS